MGILLGFVGVLLYLVISMVEVPYYHHTWAVWGVKTSGIFVQLYK